MQGPTLVSRRASGKEPESLTQEPEAETESPDEAQPEKQESWRPAEEPKRNAEQEPAAGPKPGAANLVLVLVLRPPESEGPAEHSPP